MQYWKTKAERMDNDDLANAIVHTKKMLQNYIKFAVGAIGTPKYDSFMLSVNELRARYDIYVEVFEKR